MENASASFASRLISFRISAFSLSLDLSASRIDSKTDLASVMEFQSIFSKSMTGFMPLYGMP